jgi:hypothetical protein
VDATKRVQTVTSFFYLFKNCFTVQIAHHVVSCLTSIAAHVYLIHRHWVRPIKPTSKCFHVITAERDSNLSPRYKPEQSFFITAFPPFLSYRRHDGCEQPDGD